MQTRRDSVRSRAAIMDAAETVFAEKGYDGATFSDICLAAGVSRGLPAYLFGGKDELYQAVVTRAAKRLHESTLEPLTRYAARPNATIEEAIEIAVNSYVDYLNENRKIVRLLQWEMLSNPQDERSVAPTAALFAEFRDALDTVLTNRSRNDVSASDLLSTIVALCFFPFMLGPGTGSQPFEKRQLSQRKRHILRVLLRGIASS